MQEEIVVSVRDLKKRFKVYRDKGNSLKEKLLFWERNRHEVHWVLDGISFQLHRGEALGLIGRNGCGKSTTLKLLTRIMYPTSGKVAVKGRVSSLIELGAGFHPDMTGRENIYTNASIFGLTKKQIDERLEDIIAFSELGEFIDNPVRTYSSGMYMRLAFSVAINVEADVLLVDEILAVGDISFQKKCFERLKQIKRAGVTIVIVSHALGQLEEICDRAIWIEQGKICMDDSVQTVCAAYQEKMEQERLLQLDKEYAQKKAVSAEKGALADSRWDYFAGRKVLRLGEHGAYFTKVIVEDEQGRQKVAFSPEEKMRLRIGYHNAIGLKKAVFCLRIYNEADVLCFGTDTNRECGHSIDVEQEGTITVTLEQLPLVQGKYIVDVDILQEDGTQQDVLHEAADFYVRDEKKRDGVACLHTSWKKETKK